MDMSSVTLDICKNVLLNIIMIINNAVMSIVMSSHTSNFSPVPFTVHVLLLI